MNQLPRVILLLSAASFLLFGVLSILDIGDLLAVADVKLPTERARIEVRTLYGGLELGLGAYLLICSRRRNDWDRGLLLSALCFAGLALVRAGGMFTSLTYSPPLPTLLVAEVIGLVLSVVGWALARR